MSETRLHLALTLGLVAAGALLLRIAPEPRYLDDPRWYLLFVAIAVFGAGLGVFGATVASAVAPLLRIRRRERAADAAGNALEAAARASRISPPNGQRRRSDRRQTR
jgi:hypothetical protein